MAVFVISKDGERLMPTTCLGKVRRMLKDGRAIIARRNPFTIQLTYETTNHTQPIELCIDTGYQHVGLSIKSEKKEFVSNQYDLLTNEKSRHDDCRKYRRNRRNRKRYRKPRFDNRTHSKPKGWLAPSIKNKADRHIDLIYRYYMSAPITDIYIEMGQFDIQVLQAIEEGKPIPSGIDYQHGPKYGTDTLREAVLQRDNHTCVFCGRNGIDDNLILHVHHIYFWKNRHGDRLEELATCCEYCHTQKNHQENGKLWGYDKKMKDFSGPTFMNIVRWYIYNKIKDIPTNVHITYGAVTKRSRLDLKLPKSHTNDAYCMGNYRPSIRTEERIYKKRRRNNRCLEKFYDAQYIDIRDNTKKAGKDLGCERTNRREPRNSEKNLRIYHGKKISKGRRSIRRQHHSIQPGDMVIHQNKKYIAKSTHGKGRYILLSTGKSVSSNKVELIYHVGGWILY